MSQNNHFIGVWMLDSFIGQTGEVAGSKDHYLACISWNGCSQGGEVSVSSCKGIVFPEAGY